MKQLIFIGAFAIVCLSSCDLFSKKDKSKIENQDVIEVVSSDSTQLVTDSLTTLADTATASE